MLSSVGRMWPWVGADSRIFGAPPGRGTQHQGQHKAGNHASQNSAPTEVLVDTEYITITMDGGIRMPRHPMW